MLAPIPHEEEERLKELRRCGLLDTPLDPAYDRITGLAARIFKTPIALIVLVDRERQWFKSHHGVEARETSREDAVCVYTILEDRPLVIPDLRADPRFVNTCRVPGFPPPRFYAGAPLTTPGGHRIGTLCVMDTVARADFGEHEAAILTDLAAMVLEEMELRSSSERSQHELDERKQADRLLRAAREELEHRVQQRTGDLTAANAALQQAQEELESRVRERTAELALANGNLRLLLEERDVTDAAIRQSEAKFRAMIENAQDLITILDPRGVMLYQSPSVEHIFGFRPEELVGQSIFDYIHPDDRAMVAERIASTLGGAENDVRNEVRSRHRDGGWRLLESIASRTPGDSPLSGLVVNSRDITDRRRQEELHEARNRQQAAIAELSRFALGGPELPAMFDRAVALAAATLGIRIVAVSELLPHGSQMVVRAGCGFAPGIVGHAVVENWRRSRGRPLDDHEPVVIEKLIEAAECRLLLADVLDEQPVSAVSVLIQGAGRPFGTLCALSAAPGRFREEDVTFLQTMADLLSTAILRRRGEEALRVVEARYHRIVANTPGMVFQLLIRPDRSVAMLFASEESRVIYGVEPQAFYDEPELFWKMVHAEDRPRLVKGSHAAQDRQEPFAWEGRVLLASGELIDVSIRTRPERVANGDTIWHGVAVDVTEFKRTQAALQAAKEEAERANNAKSEFLSRISHELRTPLNAILGFGQLLEMERLTTAQQCSVEQIVRGGRHLLDLINEVLDIARIESGRMTFQPEAVALPELLAATLLLVEPLAKARGIRFGPCPPADAGAPVLADRARLSQVLLNLLSNAIKYNREGGRVSFGCETLAGGRVRLSITDTGPGLTAGEVERLFTPFERLNAPSRGVEGTGIGLTISRGLVEAMGGALGVRAEPGQGCTFFVDLPATGGQPAAAPASTEPAPTPAPVPEPGRPAAPPPSVPAPAGRRRTLLHIEDQRANRDLVELALAARPELRLLESMDGESGVMRARIGRPDLILLDLHLPDIDGEEVLRRLRAEPITAGIPVIAVTADVNPDRQERLRALGVSIYLLKPLDVAQFLHVIDGVLARAEA